MLWSIKLSQVRKEFTSLLKPFVTNLITSGYVMYSFVCYSSHQPDPYECQNIFNLDE